MPNLLLFFIFFIFPSKKTADFFRGIKIGPFGPLAKGPIISGNRAEKKVGRKKAGRKVTKMMRWWKKRRKRR